MSALSASSQDIPPYMTCGGRPAQAVGVNLVGLRRAGMPESTRREIREAYKLLYRSGLTVPKAMEKIRDQFHSEEIQHLTRFIEGSRRGIVPGAREGEGFFLSRKNSSVVD